MTATLEEIEALNARERSSLLNHLDMELKQPVPEYVWKVALDPVQPVRITALRKIIEVLAELAERH